MNIKIIPKTLKSIECDMFYVDSPEAAYSPTVKLRMLP